MGFAGSANPTTVTPTDGGGMNLSGVDTGGGGQQYINDGSDYTPPLGSVGNRPFLYTLGDNLFGFNDDVTSYGEAFGTGVNDMGVSAASGGLEMLSNTVEGLAKYGDMFASAMTPTKGDLSLIHI